MKVLIVAPVEIGSGETITAIHIAEQICANGGTVHFLASNHAQRFIGSRFPGTVSELTNDGQKNRAIWDSTVHEFNPEVILFSDYPLLFFSNGVSPFADKEEWAFSLDQLDAKLVTLDHTGFAQEAKGVFFGPPHLSFHYEEWPAIPRRMEVLLPCPMHEPSPVLGRLGHPFRYWDVPFVFPEVSRQAVRRKYMANEDSYLIFHSVARWAWESAQLYRIPYYEYLPSILEYYFKDLPKPVTIVSVNNGSLLIQPGGTKLRIINLESLPKEEYEALLFGSDLMITENSISITLGKAVCGLLPCVALNNSYTYRYLLERMSDTLRDLVIAMETKRPGSIYPYEMFPGGNKDWLEHLGLYRGNTINSAFETLEIFGELQTRRKLQSLLINESARHALQVQQQNYASKVQALPGVYEILQRIMKGSR